MRREKCVSALIVLGQFLIALLRRFDESVPVMYWDGFVLPAALSQALFLVG
jgi:hypothetical protein